MPTLYDIDRQYRDALEQAIALASESDGEIPPELADVIDKLEMDRDKKIENCVAWLKEQGALANMCYIESSKLQARGLTYDKRANWMRERIAAIIGAGTKWEGRTGAISWRKSTSTSVTVPVESLPREYVSIVPEKLSADRDAIKAALKSGKVIEGCSLVHKDNIQIK